MTDHDLARVLVELVDTVGGDGDVVDFLDGLAQRCVDLLQVTAAGVVLADGHRQLHLVAGAATAAGWLDLFEEPREGPYLEALTTGRAVVDADMAAAADRWPRFAVAAAEAGVRTTSALPLRFRGRVVGALGLSSDRDRSVDTPDVGQALADIAAVALVSDHLQHEQNLPSEPLRHALASRAVIEQARGVLAARGDLGLDEALVLLRSHARGSATTLTDVARAVVRGELRLQGEGAPVLGSEGGPLGLDGRAVLDPARPRPPHPDPSLLLTAADVQLLHLLSTGRSGSEVARHLDLSPRDLARRLTEIRALLNVSSTAAAVRVAGRARSS